MVFDDMLQRSIPMYQECQNLAVHWCTKYAKPSTSVYDLGCSTGTFLLKLAQALPPLTNIKLMGLDNSQAMLEKAKESLKSSPFPCEMIQADLNENLLICNASVIVMNYTLQFIRPSNRSTLLKNIYNALVPGGSLILIEKVNSKIPGLN